MRRYETTKEEIREGFIDNCIIQPIEKAAKKSEVFFIEDHFVGRSLFLILLEKGIVRNDNDFMDEYFDKARKHLGNKGLVESGENQELSLKQILGGAKKQMIETPERADNLIIISQKIAANEWLQEAQRLGLDLKQELKIN